MPYSEPYSTLLEGIVTRLVDATGPFTKADQVKLWAELGLDEIAPSDELLRELSRGVPIALVSDGGSVSIGEDSDGQHEQKTVKVWLCASAPTIAEAITGDGTQYWGAGALQHWALVRLCDRAWSVDGWEPLKWLGTDPVPVPQANRALLVARFTSVRVQNL
jgi:hypothetical protein